MMPEEPYEGPRLTRHDVTSLNGTFVDVEIINGKLVRLQYPSVRRGQTLIAQWTPGDIETLIAELNEVKRIVWPEYVNAANTHAHFDVK